MAMSAISSANFRAASQQAMQSLTPHQHRGRQLSSNTDIDGMGSSVTTAATSTGKVGGKVDVTA
jgi:hypothetical protein